MLVAESAALPHVAAAFLLAFATVAAIDGVYIHLWKLRLHARRASYVEHLWHTASAILFAPLVVALFVVDARGPVLWLGVALVLATHLVEVFDVRAERESRRDLGGLARGEFAIHVAAVVTRSVAIVLILAAHPLASWSWDGSAMALPTAVTLVGEAVAIGAIGIALLHLVLAALHCPVCRPRFVASGGPSR
jgi:hypothetical protein